MLTDLHNLAKPVRVTGIGQGAIKQIGHHPIFGECHFMPEAPANILSFSRCRDRFEILYNYNRDFFALSPKSDELKAVCPTLIFTPEDDNSDEGDGIYRYSKNLTINPDQLLVLPGLKAKDDLDLKLYTPEQFRVARELRKLHKALFHPHDEALATLLDNGGIMDTQLNRKSVALSNEILGPCDECLEAKATDATSVRTHNYESKSLPPDNIGEHLWMDILFVKGPDGKKIPLLLALEELTSFVLTAKMKSKSAADLKDAIYKVIGYMKSFQHTVKEVHTDAEAVFGACAAYLGHLGIILKQKAPGNHARRVERFARTLRSKMRAVIKSLPYKLPAKLYVPLVQSTVIANNMVPNSQTQNKSPSYAVTGIKPSFKGSLQYKFGDSVMCFRPNIAKTDKDTMRAERALFLYFNKGQYTAEVYLVDRDEFVTRDLNPKKFRAVPITDDLINKLNQMCESQDFLGDNMEAMVQLMPRTVIPRHAIDNEIPQNDPNQNEHQNVVDEEIEASDNDEDADINVQIEDNVHDYSTSDSPEESFFELRSNILDTTSQSVSPDDPNDVPITGLHDQNVPVESSLLPQQEFISSPAEESTGANQPTSSPPRTTTTKRSKPTEVLPTREHLPRKAKSVTWQDRANDDSRLHAALTSKLRKFDKYTHRIPDDKHLIMGLNITVRKAIKEMKEAAEESIESELTSMVEKAVLDPVDYDKLTPAQKKLVLYSHMFLKEKFSALDGSFDKLKARLVGGGDVQDRENLITDPSSPTVDFLTVMIIMNLTCQQKLKTAVLDIKTAYLNADLDEEIYIAIDPECARIFVKLYPQYAKFVRKNGSLVCLVKKALYGLVQSSNLWYKHIRSTLESMGFSIDDTSDRCLFAKVNPDGTVAYILLYVDDLFIAASTDAMVDNIINQLTAAYKDLTVQKGKNLNYLGMGLKFSEDQSSVEISQLVYIQEILKFHNVTKKANSPSRRDLLDYPQGEFADPVDSKDFKSQLMKIAYVAIRTRGDFRFVVNFLATKSSSPTKHDQRCLDHLYAYLNATQEYTLRISPTDLSINAYIDASFAIHLDGMGHTGIFIHMGSLQTSGPLYCQSSKQKLLGMNSTECELIALNDAIFTILRIKQLMLFLGISIPPVRIYQDNQSAMQIALKGGGDVRKSKYMRVRVNNITNEINSGLIYLEYIPTKLMVADVLTKPLYSTLFTTLSHRLLNISIGDTLVPVPAEPSYRVENNTCKLARTQENAVSLSVQKNKLRPTRGTTNQSVSTSATKTPGQPATPSQTHLSKIKK